MLSALLLFYSIRVTSYKGVSHTAFTNAFSVHLIAKVAYFSSSVNRHIGSHYSDEDSGLDAGGKIIKIRLKSLRIDKVVPKGLNISRLQFEQSFYNSSFLVNGLRPLKKSAQLNVGDTVDMILSKNNGKILGKRMIVMNAELSKDSFLTTLRCFRALHRLDNNSERDSLF